MTHFLQQGYTHSNKVTPNSNTPYELMGVKYIQTTTAPHLNRLKYWYWLHSKYSCTLQEATAKEDRLTDTLIIAP